MREALRRRLVWAAGVGLLLQVVMFALSTLQSFHAIPQGMLAGAIYGIQTLNLFAWATVLDLAWWASGGMLLAAFAIAHRRRASPEAVPLTPEASGAEDR